MSVIVEAHISDSIGAKKAILTMTNVNGLLDVAWTKIRNGIDLARFTVDESNPVVQYFVEGYQLEIIRSWPEMGISPYVSFTGFILDIDTTTDSVTTTYTVYAYGLNHLLARRIISYDADTANRTLFTTIPAETVFKTLVTYNLGSQALASNGRDQDAVYTGLTIQADSAGGSNLSLACARANLLQTLQKYVSLAGGDFAIVKIGVASFEFRWYPNQLGTDRSSGNAKLLFALSRSNIINPKLQIKHSSAKTVGIVAGEGEKAQRAIRTLYSTNYVTNNHNEVLIDARNQGSDNTKLDQYGIGVLDTMSVIYTLQYQIVQTPTCIAERDYFLGDKVALEYSSVNQTPFIQSLAFECTSATHEAITVTTATI